MPVDFTSPQDRLRIAGEYVVRLVPGPLSSTARLSYCLGLFREFVGFGVSAPPIWAVVGRGIDDDHGAFVVTRRVAGAPLIEALHLAIEAADVALEDLCVALARYDEHKFSVGGDYLVDMKIENFVFGRLHAREEPRAYWIDHDPVYASYDREPSAVTIAQAHWHVADVADLLIQGERLIGRALPHARAALEPLFEFMTTTDTGRERAQRIRAGIAEGRPIRGRSWVEQEHRNLAAGSG